MTAGPEDRDLVRIRGAIEDLLRRRDVRGAWDRPPRRGPWTIGVRLTYVVNTIEQSAAAWRERVHGPPPPLEVPTWREGWRFRVMDLTFRLPRGERIPRALWPERAADPDRLVERIALAVLELATLAKAAERARRGEIRARHRDFGPLTLREWIRFLLVHTLRHVRRAADAVP